MKGMEERKKRRMGTRPSVAMDLTPPITLQSKLKNKNKEMLWKN